MQRRIRGRIWRVGDSVIVEGPEPAKVAAMLEYMPGNAWIALGYAFASRGEVTKAAETLATRYLRRGDRFTVVAEATKGSASDMAGLVISRILESVKGVRASTEYQKVRFRIGVDGSNGVLGIEVRRGPGGVPTGNDAAICLVSGGRHSSVLAWYALLMGYKLTLVHAKSSDDGLLAVARLYSELSHRCDPRGLELVVLEGGSVAGALSKYLKGSKGPVFTGLTAEGGVLPPGLSGRLLAPLYLLPEEKFDFEFESLGLKSFEPRTEWGDANVTRHSVRSFGGLAADASAILDGLG